MIIDCIGCLHGNYPKLEGGDLLIVTGDLTARNNEKEFNYFCSWMHDQNYSKKVFIAGNHDKIIENWDKKQDSEGYNGPMSDADDEIEYLCDSGTEFDGLKIWGSPWTSTFKGINPKCKAFTYDDETEFYDKKVLSIPRDTDILITHGPAYGILDGIPMQEGSEFHVGSTALLGWLKYCHRPELHVFSHIHEAYGIKEEFVTHDDKMMQSINCSHVNAKYQPVNKPIRVIL